MSRGILYVLAMTATFALLDASAKWAGQQLPVLEVIWGRFIFNVAFVVLVFMRGNVLRLLRTQRPVLQATRAMFMLGATVSFWSALQFLPLAEATTIGFAAPLFVTALSVPFLKERVGIYRWTAVMIGLVGVIVAMRPGSTALHWAAILPLCSAFCYATYQIVTRKLAAVDPAGTTLFYTAAGGLILSTLAVPFVWVTPLWWHWLMFAWLGALGALGHYFLVKAFEAAPASLLAPFTYATLVWAILLGWLMFGNFPDGWTLVGAAIIVSSGLFILYRERVVRKRARRA